MRVETNSSSNHQYFLQKMEDMGQANCHNLEFEREMNTEMQSNNNGKRCSRRRPQRTIVHSCGKFPKMGKLQ